jgi:hypothetical protein
MNAPLLGIGLYTNVKIDARETTAFPENIQDFSNIILSISRQREFLTSNLSHVPKYVNRKNNGESKYIICY